MTGKFRKYNTTGAQLYYFSQQVDVVRNCNGFTVTNTGDNIVRVNEMILYPGTIGTILGTSRSIGGNEGEIYIGNIRVAFAQPNTALQQIEIIQKFYVEDDC